MINTQFSILIIRDTKKLVETLVVRIGKVTEDTRNELVEVKNSTLKTLEEDLNNGIPKAHIEEFKKSVDMFILLLVF